MRAIQFKLQRIFVLAGMLSLFVVYLLLWGRMIVNPADRTGTDFIAFYAAGRVAQENGLANAYNIDLQQGIQEYEVGFQLGSGQVLLYNHMPYLIPLLQVLVSQNYVASFSRWAILLIGVFAAGIYALRHWFPDYERPTSKHLFWASSILFYPSFVSLLLGQDSALLFLGVALIGCGVFKKQDWVVGIGLALTTVRPHFVLLFLIPFLFMRRKVLWWFLIFGGFLALVSISILGFQGTKSFINILLISAGGEWYGMNENSMYNLIGLLSRMPIFISPSAIRTIGWIAYLSGILAIFVWAARTKELRRHHLNWIILVCILLSPHFHFHDLTLLLFPLLTVGRVIEMSLFYRGIQVILQPLVTSILLLVGSFAKAANLILPYILIALLALLLSHQSQIKPESLKNKL